MRVIKGNCSPGENNGAIGTSGAKDIAHSRSAEILSFEKFRRVRYNSNVNSGVYFNRVALLREHLIALGYSERERGHILITAEKIERDLETMNGLEVSSEFSTVAQKGFAPERLYRGKLLDGDPEQFLRTVWEQPLLFGNLTQAKVRAVDPKLFKAITNALGPNTANLLHPAVREGRPKKPLPLTPEDGLAELIETRYQSRERSAKSRAKRKKDI